MMQTDGCYTGFKGISGKFESPADFQIPLDAGWQASHTTKYEAKQETPYTKEDIDWTNKESRSSMEMNDKAFRPPIANEVENMGQYSTTK